MKSGNLNFLEPSGPLQACNGTALHLPFNKYVTRFYCIGQTSGADTKQRSQAGRQTDGHGLHTNITFPLPLRQRLIIYIVKSPNNRNSNRQWQDTCQVWLQTSVSISCLTERHNHALPVYRNVKSQPLTTLNYYNRYMEFKSFIRCQNYTDGI